MTDEAPKLTALGKFITFILIAGLIALGVWIMQNDGPQPQSMAPQGSPSTTPATNPPTDPTNTKEAPDAGSITTVKEYKYVVGDKLPQVKGASQYKWNDADKVLRFSYNVWAGWLPVIAANGGTKANPDSIFAKRYGFKVEMVLMDDPVAARDAFVAGEIHALWGTVDMMVLFAPELVRDSRTAPRIVQQIDWSNGGDGIVVRKSVRTARDLKGKTVSLAQNSPSEYYLTSLLLSAGLKPADVKMKYTATAFEAAAAFVADNSIDACVSWAPDIYNISDRLPGTRILSSTKDANKLIADVYAVRADFMRDHPDVVQGLVEGILEGIRMVKSNPQPAAQAMADAFGMKTDDVLGMRNDAHLTNAAENAQFFLNASNPTNFERTWKNSAYVYRELGRINVPVPFDQVMDYTVIQKAVAKPEFAKDRDESVASFTPAPARRLQAEAPILTQTIRINFFPNSANPFEPARNELGMVESGRLYDPNVTSTMEQVARLSGQFARASILIEGHTDASMKGRVPDAAVKQLSSERAEAIKRALVDKYRFDPNKFTIVGKGWDSPADPSDSGNHAQNRRVEISVYSPEGE